MNEHNFDERQLIVRGKIGLRTTILSMTLLLISAFFADGIMEVFDMSDYLLSLVMLILTYVSVSLIWHDAYIGLAPIGSMNIFMYTLVILFLAQIGLMIFHLFQGLPFVASEHLLNFMNIIFSGSVGLTVLLKKKANKD